MQLLARYWQLCRFLWASWECLRQEALGYQANIREVTRLLAVLLTKVLTREKVLDESS
jgi:hypothetical protein